MDNENLVNDKRRFTRVVFSLPVHVVSAEGSWHCQLLDISLKGILTTLPKSWHGKIGGHYLVELPLENTDVSIRMEVSVSHIEEDHVGFRCEHIDLDSISHLRRLVELNVGDAEVLDRELTELSSQN